MAYLIYNAADVEAVIEACQPVAGHEGCGPLVLGTPLESIDGRYCHCHSFSEAEQDFFLARCDGIAGVLVTDTLPADFIPKGE